jgi:lipoprotein-anchoring transpeptidase ErfK/SrfK
MQTIKSAIVIALLLTVCYGAFKAMNTRDVEIPEDLKTWADQNGKDVLPDFEIPTITNNDPFLLPGEKQSGDLPQFPAIDLPPTNSVGNNSIGGPQSLPANSLELPKLPQLSSSNSTSPSLADNSLPTLPGDNNPIGNSTSTVPLQVDQQASSFPPRSSGPAIPFNPNLNESTLLPVSGTSLTADKLTSADDLINAIGGTTSLTGFDGSNSALNANDSNANSTPSANPTPTDPSSPTNSDTPSDSKSNQPTQPFSVARTEALRIASEGKLREALEQMTQYYDSPDLGYTEHTDLIDILDALSREVIYSDRHLLVSPHTVSAQDTLQSVADEYKITPELLAAVNKMGSSLALVPNTQIKVVEGPFRAQVSLARGELTLFVRKLYAGRFPVSISQKNRPPQTRYEIVDRRLDRTFYNGSNARIPASDPTNPFGGFWLSLGGEYSIHGSPEQVSTDLANAGCISLAPLDAADVYRILSKGCVVEIKP